MPGGRESGAAVQGALIVEYHQRAGFDTRAQLEARLAHQQRETAVGSVERLCVARIQLRGAIERLL